VRIAPAVIGRVALAAAAGAAAAFAVPGPVLVQTAAAAIVYAIVALLVRAVPDEVGRAFLHRGS
jgi:prepilin signal peptidase PulO-like enzyme (type II secretory pathway)